MNVYKNIKAHNTRVSRSKFSIRHCKHFWKRLVSNKSWLSFQAFWLWLSLTYSTDVSFRLSSWKIMYSFIGTKVRLIANFTNSISHFTIFSCPSSSFYYRLMSRSSIPEPPFSWDLRRPFMWPSLPFAYCSRYFCRFLLHSKRRFSSMIHQVKLKWSQDRNE